jgi:alanine dehydrogenase
MTTPLTVGVVKETERRVALVPDGVRRLTAAGMAVLVETDAGAAAWLGNDAYAEAGADVVTRDELYRRADLVLTVDRIDNELYADPKTGMFFADARKGLAALTAAVKVLVGASLS